MVGKIELSKRQETIIDIVKHHGPITGEQIAEMLSLTRATLRPDLSILTMAGYIEARPRVGYFFSGKKNVDLFAETLHKLKVQDYKSMPIVVSEKVSAYEAIVTMFMEDVGTLIVARDGLLLGVVSRKDLLKAAIGGGDINQLPINMVMTRVPHVVTCDADASLYDAAVLMVQHEVDSLPVIHHTDNGRSEVAGRISKTTITKVFVELGQSRDI